MESVVAALLRDFEHGKLTRRQLVQTLALMAVGSPVASAVAQSVAASPAKPAGTPWKTVWLDHISFQVSDYKRSVDFYSDLMGWKVLNDTGTQATVDINGIGGIIIRNRRRPGEAGPNAPGQPPAGQPAAQPPAAQPPAAQPARPDSSRVGAGAAQPSRPPITGVIDHISWGIEPWDTETVRSELLKRGLTPREDTGNRGSMETSPFKSFHVRDPDGWDLQISNQTKEKHEL
jgi:catechol 2,3-dioxygenase-like lactoylglutathione lyase family enzyme